MCIWYLGFNRFNRSHLIDHTAIAFQIWTHSGEITSGRLRATQTQIVNLKRVTCIVRHQVVNQVIWHFISQTNGHDEGLDAIVGQFHSSIRDRFISTTHRTLKQNLLSLGAFWHTANFSISGRVEPSSNDWAVFLVFTPVIGFGWDTAFNATQWFNTIADKWHSDWHQCKATILDAATCVWQTMVWYYLQVSRHNLDMETDIRSRQ